MGKYKDEHGKTMIGRVLQVVGKAAPEVLSLASNIPGLSVLDKAADIIKGKTDINSDDKDILLAKLEDAKQIEIARLADMDSARKMQQVALTQNDLFSKRFVYYLATLWSLAGIGFIFTVLFIDIPDNSIRLVDTILGFVLGTIIAGIINYFFGSSSGSDKKTDLINNLKDSIK